MTRGEAANMATSCNKAQNARGIVAFLAIEHDYITINHKIITKNYEKHTTCRMSEVGKSRRGGKSGSPKVVRKSEIGGQKSEEVENNSAPDS